MNFEIDDRLSPAINEYCALRDIDPPQEVKRRAKNVGIKLIGLYGDASPPIANIISAVDALDWRVKTRKSARIGPGGKRLSRRAQIKKELRLRIASRKFSATGWFTPVTKLGGNPRGALKGKKPVGQGKGELIEQLYGNNPSEELVNLYLGAAQTDALAGGAVKKACDAEADDIKVYLEAKKEKAAQKAGLKH